MIRNKEIYGDYEYLGCDDYTNCTECIEKENYICWWFDNMFMPGDGVDKMPMIEYEWCNDQK